MIEQSAAFYPECVECLSQSRFYLDNHHRIHETKYQVKRGQSFPQCYEPFYKVRLRVKCDGKYFSSMLEGRGSSLRSESAEKLPRSCERGYCTP